MTNAQPPEPSNVPGRHTSQPPTEGEAVSVSQLGPDSTGQWLVRSQSSEHEFDLDARTYRRRPGPGHRRFRNDARIVRLTRVVRWPKVGGTFFIWVDDHEYPDLVEHWHQSSSIRSITAVTPEASGPWQTPEDPSG